MKVFKFGGASVNSVERIKNMASIVKQYAAENLFIIVSAMGKTTNALEKIAESFFKGNNSNALQLFEEVKQLHLETAKTLLPKNFELCQKDLSSFFTEAEWLLHDNPVRKYDYYYDQIVSIGELLSTCIISHYLNEINITNTWLDVRDIIRTDNNFRDATVDWVVTASKIEKYETTISSKQQALIYITQGFIGATDDNETTTLGREGSDYSAAIFANLLNAESLTIWKDVEGVMNADPKQFIDAQLISELNFEEVIEMAFYGAQVIHPKTIKPLQNKKIPLLVKCFLDNSLAGTIIHDKIIKQLPPIIVVKENQVLMHLHSQDFSFVGEKPMSFLYNLFEEVKIKPNLIQTGAISVQICLDNTHEKLEEFATKAATIFNVKLQKQLVLITVRNYTKETIEKLLINRTVLLQQQTSNTFQALCF
jgi:aspartate kinase